MGLVAVLGSFCGEAFVKERGRIKLFGKMDWHLVPSKALAENFQSIAEKNGKEYLYRLGYEAGRSAADEMIRYMCLVPGRGWAAQNAVLKLLELTGFGRAEFATWKIKRDGQHHFQFHVWDNPVIEHARGLFGERSMVCNWFMGIYAAHGEIEMGIRNGTMKENLCVCRGSPYCEWETKWWKEGEEDSHSCRRERQSRNPDPSECRM
jgi:hypothetical protein